MPRSVLKSFFQTGDKPNQEKKSDVDADVAVGSEVSGDKPSEAQFGDVIDSSLNLTDDRGLLGLKEYNSTKGYLAGDTVVKSDVIYQAKVLTQSQKEFKLTTDQAVTFRWTPIVPKPQEPVTYRIKVWQLMQGQSSTTAMKTNKPIATKDVDNVTEVTVGGIYTGPCKPPYLCDYVWSVEVLAKESSDTPIETSAGASTSTSLKLETETGASTR